MEEQVLRDVGREIEVNSKGITVVIVGEGRRVARETVGAHTHCLERRIVGVGAIQGRAVSDHGRAGRRCYPGAVGRSTEAEGVWVSVGTSDVRSFLRALRDLVGLFHVGRAEGHGHGAEEAHVEVLGEVRLDLHFLVRQVTRAEGRRRIRAHRRVDRVKEGVGDLIETVTVADVVVQTASRLPPTSKGERVILDFTDEAGREATGELFKRRVDRSISFPQIFDRAVTGVTVEEAPIAFFLGVVTVGVKLNAVVEIDSGVVEQ